MKTVEWFKINESARTFDLVLFKNKRGSGRLLSFAQKLFTGNGGYSHASIYIKGQDLPIWSPYFHPQLNYVFESSTAGRGGVSMTPIENALDSYKSFGSATLFILNDRYRPDFSPDDLGELVSLIDHKGFENNPLLLVPSLHKSLRMFRPKANPSRYFCSQFVAYIYKRIGVLHDSVEPLNALPVDFAFDDLDGEIPPDLFVISTEYIL